MALRIGMVSVWMDDESVMSWFKARATSMAAREDIEKGRQAYAKVLLGEVTADLHKIGFTGVKLKWSRQAGCSCGCSPGYIIKVEGHRSQKMWDKVEYAYASDRNYLKELLSYYIEKNRLVRTTHEVTKRMVTHKRTWRPDPSAKRGGRIVRVRDTYERPVYSINNLQQEMGLGAKTFIASI